MHPGYYVARVMRAPKSTKLKMESCCFDPNRETEDSKGYALRSAQHWRDFVQSEQPDHELVVIQVLPPLEGKAPLPEIGLNIK